MQLFGLDPEYDRLRIRALRATFNPSGDDERRRLVFIGALGQFDELMTAAASVGPASRPLPLYYALNQAGRAIVAQRQMRDQPWEPKSHGLTVGDPPDGWLQQTPIKPQRHENSSFGLLVRINQDGATHGTHLPRQRVGCNSEPSKAGPWSGVSTRASAGSGPCRPDRLWNTASP